MLHITCSSAEVLVTLRNRGSEAYKPESFGDRIIVERQIKRDGSGVYKLKGARGTKLACTVEPLLKDTPEIRMPLY